MPISGHLPHQPDDRRPRRNRPQDRRAGMIVKTSPVCIIGTARRALLWTPLLNEDAHRSVGVALWIRIPTTG
jgi:hypothetical protein